MNRDAPTHPPLLVACLCAQWCGTCRDYRAVMDQVQRGFVGRVPPFTWVDIEDHDEVAGSLDIEDFPTLLIARGDELLFFGSVTPHAQTLSRLVQSALDGSLHMRSDDAELHGLPQRVRTLLAG